LGKQRSFCVVFTSTMVVDLYKIQAAIGSGGSQTSPNYKRRLLTEEESDDKSTDFGLEGDEPDCRVYLAHSVTTLSWLKSHHLLVT
jgi:hypothetical protein